MKKMGWIVFLFGVLVFVGGFMGYLSKKSLPSLMSGIIFGVLLIANSLWIFKNKIAALYTALALSFVLDGFFTFRFVQKQQFFPSGLMSILSLVIIFSIVWEIRGKLKKPSH
jgi:uncharacterized membrane protein (UPF0136 family)